ncbi:hypothetical protein A3759_26760 [Thalassolituus sp. HI0120]|nr:hypothetical protein A3759_09110 [Thalassolituus sp. HI0120]KZZ49240.1 hypothetical protein A3759_26760 [Thalassolituus sp. HI0120]
MRHAKGFTLVELVMVILLIGILSAIGSSLFTNQGVFSAFAARDQFLAMALLAQKRALADASNNTVTLTISQNSDAWQLDLVQGSGTGQIVYQQRTVDRAGASLSVDGSLMVNGASQAVSYNSDAETGVNRQFLFAADNSYAFCLASTGFAYTGSCQP